MSRLVFSVLDVKEDADAEVEAIEQHVHDDGDRREARPTPAEASKRSVPWLLLACLKREARPPRGGESGALRTWLPYADRALDCPSGPLLINRFM